MHYRMSKPDTLENGNTRTIVTFYEGKEVLLTEEFITNIVANHSRIVTDEQGRYRTTSGDWVTDEQVQARAEDVMTRQGERNPPTMYEFEREEFTIDFGKDVLEKHVEEYLYRVRDDGSTNAERLSDGRLRGDRVDHRNDSLVRSEKAQHLRVASVEAVVGKDRQVAVARRDGGR